MLKLKINPSWISTGTVLILTVQVARVVELARRLDTVIEQNAAEFGGVFGFGGLSSNSVISLSVIIFSLEVNVNIT